MRTIEELRELANSMNKSLEELLYEMLNDAMNENEKYMSTGKTIFEFENIPENSIDLKMIIHRNELYCDLSKLDDYRGELYKYEQRSEIPVDEIINKLDDIILTDFNMKINDD